MGNGFRRFLAATQIAGGVAVLVTPGILTGQGMSLIWWYWILLQCLGGTAVAAGIWLWRDEPRGWRLSRWLQALQIVQFQTASFGIAVVAGFQLRLIISGTGLSFGPAFFGTLSLTAGSGMPWWVGINFFSLYALHRLFRDMPKAARARLPDNEPWNTDAVRDAAIQPGSATPEIVGRTADGDVRARTAAPAAETPRLPQR